MEGGGGGRRCPAFNHFLVCRLCVCFLLIITLRGGRGGGGEGG